MGWSLLPAVELQEIAQQCLRYGQQGFGGFFCRVGARQAKRIGEAARRRHSELSRAHKGE